MMSKSKRRPAYDIVLRAMNNGIEVELSDGNTYAMIDNMLCIKMKVWKDGRSPFRDPEPDEIRYHDFALPFNVFSKMCDEMSEEQLMGLIFQNVMKKQRDDND